MATKSEADGTTATSTLVGNHKAGTAYMPVPAEDNTAYPKHFKEQGNSRQVEVLQQLIHAANLQRRKNCTNYHAHRLHHSDW
jgi:hypothetical protein